MIRLLHSPWMVSLLGSLIYLTTTAALIRPGKLHVTRPPAPETQAAIGPSWDFRNPEFQQMVEELKTQKEDLKKREQMLKELETRLEVERAEVVAVTQTVARLQQAFDGSVIRLRDEEAANLKKLAKLHAAMSPEASAGIFKELSEDDAAKILTYMKVDEAGPVLEALSKLGKDEAKRAALLSERMQRTISAAPAGKPNSP